MKFLKANRVIWSEMYRNLIRILDFISHFEVQKEREKHERKEEKRKKGRKGE